MGTGSRRNTRACNEVMKAQFKSREEVSRAFSADVFSCSMNPRAMPQVRHGESVLGGLEVKCAFGAVTSFLQPVRLLRDRAQSSPRFAVANRIHRSRSSRAQRQGRRGKLPAARTTSQSPAWRIK